MNRLTESKRCTPDENARLSTLMLAVQEGTATNRQRDELQWECARFVMIELHLYVPLEMPVKPFESRKKEPETWDAYDVKFTEAVEGSRSKLWSLLSAYDSARHMADRYDKHRATATEALNKLGWQLQQWGSLGGPVPSDPRERHAMAMRWMPV